jgi:cell division protein FtsB
MIKKHKNKRFFTGLFLTPYFFTLVCLIIIAVVLLPIYKNARQRFEVNGQIADLQKQIASLEASNNDLTKLGTYLQSDQYAEKKARLDMGLKMPGEHVAVIENSDSLASQFADHNSADKSANEKKSNQLKWWNYFFGG